LEECHAKGFLWKAIGSCNQEKRDLNKCLRSARLERTAMNREKAKVARAKVQAEWKDIEANS